MKFLKGAVLGVILGTVGGYLFNPKSGKANREKVQVVAKKLMQRLMTEVNAVSGVTKREYSAIVKKVIQDFKTDKTLSKEAWDSISAELMERWKVISAQMKEKVKKTKTAK
jgi:gas vesicle protein